MPNSMRLFLLVIVAGFPETLCSQQSGPTASRPLSMRQAPIIQGQAHGIESMAWMGSSRAGRIAVADRGKYRMLLFSSNGVLEASVGRKGEGPGEFLDLSGGGWVAETLWVNDVRRMTTTFIAPGGKVLRSVRWPTGVTGSLPQPVMPGAGIATRPRAFSPSGDLLLFLPLRPPAGTTFSPGTLVASSRADGTVLEILGTTSRSCSITTDIVALHTLVCGTELTQVSPNGDLFVTAREKPSSKTTSAVNVVLTDRRGQVLFDRTITRTAYAMPGKVRDSILTFFRGKKNASGGDAGAAAERALPKASVISMIARAEVASDSTVWLLMNAPSGAFWQVIDGKGRDIVTLVPPVGVTLREVGRQSALGFIRDDEEVPTLVRLTWR